MNISVSSLHRVTDTARTAESKSLRTIPSGDDLEKRSLIRANGGVSKDGDTVSVSRRGLEQQKLHETEPQDIIDFLKEDTDPEDNVAKAVSSAAGDIGISRELNEKRLASAEADMVSSVEIADRASEETDDRSNVNTANLSQYPPYELKEMVQDGDISMRQYMSEMDSRDISKSVPPQDEKENIQANLRKEPTEQDRLEKMREEKNRESALREKERSDDLQNDKVKFSFADSPYDVTASVKEAEEDDEAAGVNRIERDNREREEIRVRISEVPETAEDNEEIENITVNLNAGYAAENDNSSDIAATQEQTATDTVNENTANNRVIIQEVS